MSDNPFISGHVDALTGLDETDEQDVKIVQLLITPNDALWQGRLIGLASNGWVYECSQQGRVPSIAPPETTSEKPF